MTLRSTNLAPIHKLATLVALHMHIHSPSQRKRTSICSTLPHPTTTAPAAVLMLMAIMAEKRVEMMTGGAIGALVIGLVAPLMWEKGWPRGLSQGHRQHYAHALEHTTAMVSEGDAGDA